MTCRNVQRQYGFSLLEMAVVLLVLSLILAGTIGPMDRRIEQRDRTANKVLLDQALEAIYGFAVVNCRLPCPDTGGDGQEDRGALPAQTCTSLEGNLPWVTLGVSELDSWGRRFLYRVTGVFADTNPTNPPTPGSGSSLNCPFIAAQGAFAGGLASTFDLTITNAGDITVQNETGGCPPPVPPPTPPVASVAYQVPAIILSQGKTPDPTPPTVVPCLEAANADADVNAIFMIPTVLTDPANALFSDDMVTWVVPGILKTRMLQAQKLP